MRCEAYRAGDQMQCSCGLAWDVTDPEPPMCRGHAKVDREVVLERRSGAERRVPFRGSVALEAPLELPVDVAHEMARAAGAAAGYAFGTVDGLAAMNAAYRVFLDRLA